MGMEEALAVTMTNTRAHNVVGTSLKVIVICTVFSEEIISTKSATV